VGGLLGKIISAPFSDVVKSIGGIIDNLNTSEAEKLAAQRELVKLQLDFNAKVLESDNEFVKAQAGVVTAEANSGSWMARNWRPILMLTFTYIVAHNFIIAPLFHVQAVPIPQDMWELLRIGMGGYIAGRSVEKVAPAIATAITSAKQK
jgi:hypothetical protein